ncbi:MAG: ATP-binding cassette subfamily F protein uup, partial [Maribacter sp.]
SLNLNIQQTELMNYLTLEHITKNYGEKNLFDDITLHIDKGQKIALVAKNGTGKSTLLKVLNQEEGSEREDAKIYIHKDITTGFLHQEPHFNPEDTVIEAVFDSDSEILQAIRKYEEAMILEKEGDELQDILDQMDRLKAWDFEAKIQEILTRFNVTDLYQKVGTMSGGQQKRVALAKVLIEEPDFLILDEPTNHLDVDMISWLEQYLSSANKTVFMITHDRYFLDTVCNVIYELENGELHKYKGNYSYYLEKKAERNDIESATMDKTKKLFKRELDWVRRQPKARTTKAKSRVDTFHDLKEKTSVKVENSDFKLEFKAERLGKKIVECHNVSKYFGDFKAVESFSYKFKKKERVGIVGPNGVGKSTFIKLLTQEYKPDTGKVVVGETIVFGHYNQEGMKIDESKTVLDVIRDIAEEIPLAKGQKLTASAFLEKFLFTRKQQRVYVSKLSGGEKRRLYLLTVLIQNPNFLILDEPTNDLDILTLNILEEFLTEFQGCLVLISHDRYFMDKLTDHLFVFEGEGKIKDWNGNYKEYRSWKKEEAIAKRQKEQQPVKTIEIKEKPKSDAPKLSYAERKEFNRLEKEIDKLEKQREALSALFNDAGITAEKIKETSIKLNEINEIIEEKEMRWLELGELV